MRQFIGMNLQSAILIGCMNYTENLMHFEATSKIRHALESCNVYAMVLNVAYYNSSEFLWLQEREETTSYKEHLIRRMVAKVGDTSRKIVQFHYVDWPDAGVPRCIPGILDLIERLREVQPLSAKETPPVVFHCR